MQELAGKLTKTFRLHYEKYKVYFLLLIWSL
jgi:hypothetical protein